ncbi:MAG: response regulator [Spirochaetia bacterium]|jgi:signal transduction histidine kinase|nr:response regulator [Spirochaetia bacterium]
MDDEPGRKPRIAVCEDERIVALDIRNFLQRNGYEVCGLYVAAEDLLASVEHELPDLVLMDIHLQGVMDGVEAASILFKRWAVPVILLTAYTDGPTIERAKLTHPYAYILKPYDERELRTAIAIGLYRSSMEKRLRSSEERYRALFDEALAAIFLVDSEGALVQGNNAYRQLAGSIVHIDGIITDSGIREAFKQALEAGQSAGPAEIAFAREDGATCWVLISATPFPLNDGKAAYQYHAIDVTERKALSDQLAQSQKMEALGRLAGGVAHDFNNIITAIMGYSRLLRMDETAGLEDKAELIGIEEAAKRAANLARQLLVFSRGESSVPTVFSVTDLIRELSRMIERLISQDVNIRMRLDDEPCRVRADRSKLEQVVVNLVVNARDAMPTGGRITISTGSAVLAHEERGIFGLIPPGRWSYITIADEGEGIDPRIIPRIFEPFFTTKAAGVGTGLGLSTVAGIVRQAEGHLTLQSVVHSGTRFTVYLPWVEGEVTTLTTSSELDGQSGGVRTRESGRGETVLLVEDDDSVRAIIETVLDRSGYRVVATDNPGTALLLAERSEQVPDILVSDVLMPLMRGPELATRLRAILPSLPVLLLSADASELQLQGADLGSGYLQLAKPFKESDLLGSVRTLLDQQC